MRESKMKIFITANGLEDIPTCAEPASKEVQACKEWITKFTTKRKTINDKHWSYGLKHKVEKWVGFYIPNGAFIQAAVELGYDYKRVRKGLNANFNMSFPRVRTKEYKEAFGFRD